MNCHLLRVDKLSEAFLSDRDEDTAINGCRSIVFGEPCEHIDFFVNENVFNIFMASRKK
jgi:hypothetical protein